MTTELTSLKLRGTAHDERVTPSCVVCGRTGIRPFQTVAGWVYWRCPDCMATFCDAAHLPGEQAEMDRYLQHNNVPDDPRYRRFLDTLARPLLARLAPGSEGLDYGCGPGPALAMMLTEAGHRMRLYDPFFHPDASALQRSYDFISCTEVAEHFHHPAAEFEHLDRLLRPGGWLAVMTSFLNDDERFADWYYRRDPTHVVFYREETFRYLATRFAWQCEFPVPNVVLMRKGPRNDPGESPFLCRDAARK
jgi:SAM-dependent methyltransferase